ncbi:hypothetical protein BV25DRAFT_1406935 [Artomyces pyxidatus]|uniref:Uncharacterized protein n=1 Tax=Artomyces pyxidatus TaxID=48021 RepID=A0ACB8TDV4_9AGAM|nr:hypothetical protein BV25DRAFT_1406935 [Artomyces pyxidatus]
MGRWTQYDEDDYRLPEGMKRVGYDADSGKYFFRDQDGSLWEGAAEYGEMKRVSDAPAPAPEDDDVETGPTRADGYAPLPTDARVRYAGDSPYRMLFPFILIVIVVLLLVWRLVVAPAMSARKPCVCPAGSTPSTVVSGDTCWDIAKAHGCALDVLLKLNPTLRCEKLVPGDRICVPTA